MHQHPNPRAAEPSEEHAPLDVASPVVLPFVGRRLKVLNLCQSDEELNHGVDFFSWHGAMTRLANQTKDRP